MTYFYPYTLTTLKFSLKIFHNKNVKQNICTFYIVNKILAPVKSSANGLQKNTQNPYLKQFLKKEKDHEI